MYMYIQYILINAQGPLIHSVPNLIYIIYIYNITREESKVAHDL
jgi:hypothetical protein